MSKWLTVLCTALVWCCYLCSIPAATSMANNETDRFALLAFKAAIVQDPFGALSSWNHSLHYCHWNGILCSQRHPDRVIGITLRSQGLVGSLSTHIGNLSFLKSINLQNNIFHGPIPQEMGRLFRLQTIEFSTNSFGGGIPNNLSRCSKLEWLNLIDNNLTGNIPAELGSLSRLGTLALRKNKLSGTIPPFIGNLSSLFQISFSECNLHGEIPAEIARLRGLRLVLLSENNLSGKVPSGLYNISTIILLAVTINQLEGNIPPDIGSTLPNLKFLYFGENLFTGTLPNSLSNASELEEIFFPSNDFSGTMPRDLGKLLGLQRIVVYNNRLQDDLTFISSLTNCTSLQYIDAGNNSFRGSLPDSIGNLSTYLSIINLQINQIHGSIPSGIGNLLNLTVLSMAANNLAGPIPSSIGRLQQLHALYLGLNKFTKLPSSLGNLTLLITLNLQENNIHGSIPPSLGNCHSLFVLFLDKNNFTGSIPPEIMSLSSISAALSLAHNALTGSLPLEVGSLTNLGYMDVSYNKLSGPIPNTLRNCLSLEWLHLEANSFEGEIPQSLRILRGLRVLDLSRNNLSGLIPSYLGELQLDILNLSFNRLHGQVPIQGVFQNGSAISIVGNNGLCGGIAKLDLPPCAASTLSKNKLSHRMKVILVIGLVTFLSFLACFFIFLRWRHVSKNNVSSTPSVKHQLLRVSYAELFKATNGFSEANLIGVGGYASVYKGILDQVQMVVAVKVLNLHNRGASKSFMTECKALRAIRHRNLLKILSVCSSVDFKGNEFKALVYEFMTNGSLGKWLHQVGVEDHGRPEEPRYLKLIQRLDISIDVASGLGYLHCGCESTIIHGDLKPSNILLDDEMTAHIGDFGLAKIISTVSSDVARGQSNSAAIRGTIGYIAPEYGMGDMASTLGDVYSFGILLLEMFTGKRPTDDMFNNYLNLHNFVKNDLPDRVMEIVDPCILLEHNTKRQIKDYMVSVLRIGVACSMESPRDRMEMESVISELRRIKTTYMNEGLNQD
ncbi:putative receptor-like protein kinase At3g47110 [Camellia sinensis]|uniref:putative receptor-like protein kinase At3g47110 n=1 Tax=Camellia sinensis TaxID=4442 RepID=UPI001035B656|nr:putative receptor-like protein kinase At3g47110 [Camellia sinensis]XP_028107409.1 putative receptor-like protein kinase At3g47110 [Camellia sinensis]